MSRRDADQRAQLAAGPQFLRWLSKQPDGVETKDPVDTYSAQVIGAAIERFASSSAAGGGAAARAVTAPHTALRAPAARKHWLLWRLRSSSMSDIPGTRCLRR